VDGGATHLAPPSTRQGEVFHGADHNLSSECKAKLSSTSEEGESLLTTVDTRDLSAPTQDLFHLVQRQCNSLLSMLPTSNASSSLATRF
jgi:hypothetical protein